MDRPKMIRIRIQPMCESRWRWLAWSRWALASWLAWCAFRCIDGVFAISDDVDIDARVERAGRWTPE